MSDAVLLLIFQLIFYIFQSDLKDSQKTVSNSYYYISTKWMYKLFSHHVWIFLGVWVSCYIWNPPGWHWTCWLYSLLTRLGDLWPFLTKAPLLVTFQVKSFFFQPSWIYDFQLRLRLYRQKFLHLYRSKAIDFILLCFSVDILILWQSKKAAHSSTYQTVEGFKICNISAKCLNTGNYGNFPPVTH